MTSVSEFLNRAEDRYYERSWYRSGMFWMVTVLCVLAHVRLIEAIAGKWPLLDGRARFLGVIAVVGLLTPYLAGLRYHARTRTRMMREASVELRREIGRVQTFAVGFLYFVITLIVDVLTRN